MADKYRSHMSGEEEKDTQWKSGGPPNYGLVNKLFEEGRTQVWEEGSLEEKVQNLIKTWEMEMSHKIRKEDIKTVNFENYKVTDNGRQPLPPDVIAKIGGYNAHLQSSLPLEYQYYKADEETKESSFTIFLGVFPRGFAFEVLEVYSGPPKIVFKFRHWGFMEGQYKDYAPTGQKAEFKGIAILKVGKDTRIEEIEFYYDPSELFGGLLKGPKVNHSTTATSTYTSSPSCPLMK